jgi:hypothetical protein
MVTMSCTMSNKNSTRNATVVRDSQASPCRWSYTWMPYRASVCAAPMEMMTSCLYRVPWVDREWRGETGTRLPGHRSQAPDYKQRQPQP